MIKNLVLSGGAFRGYCYLGIFKYLNEKTPNFCKNLENIVGVSIGALFGSLLCVGYTAEELISIFCEINEEEFRNITTDSILNFLENFGLDDGEKLVNLINILFKGKGFSIEITFKQLYKLTNINLQILGCCLNTTEEIYFNHNHNPDMRVIQAIRISTSIPFLYNPILIDDKYYVDGAIINNYPIEIFDDQLDDTMGILLIGTDYHYQEISTIQHYINSIVRNSMFNNIKKKIEKYKKHTIVIECTQCPYDFSISKETKCSLIDLGYDIIKKSKLC